MTESVDWVLTRNGVRMGSAASGSLTTNITIPSGSMVADEYGIEWVPTPEPEPVDYTKYIRETHPEDEVLQAFAAVIEANSAIWMAMTQLYKAGECAGDGLKRWKVEKGMDVNGVITTDLILSIIDKEGTVRARAK